MKFRTGLLLQETDGVLRRGNVGGDRVEEYRVVRSCAATVIVAFLAYSLEQHQLVCTSMTSHCKFRATRWILNHVLSYIFSYKSCS
jgi:hypothetical protein